MRKLVFITSGDQIRFANRDACENALEAEGATDIECGCDDWVYAGGCSQCDVGD